MATRIIFFLMCLLSIDARMLHDANNQKSESATILSTNDHQDSYYLEFSVTPNEDDMQMMVGEYRNIEYHVKSNIHKDTQLSVLFSTSVDKVIKITNRNPDLVTITKYHTISFHFPW